MQTLRESLLAVLVTLPLLGAVAGAAMFAPAGSRTEPLSGCELSPSPNSLWREHKELKTVAEAEEFVCHELVQPRKLFGWELEAIDAFLLGTPDGDAPIWQARLRYTLGTYGNPTAKYLVFGISASGPWSLREVVEDSFNVGPYMGTIEWPRDTADVVWIEWAQDGLFYSVSAQLGDDFRLGNLETMLRSVAN